MNLPFDERTLNELFPFGLVTDRSGIIQILGRSLQRLFVDIQTGEDFAAAFTIIRPLQPKSNAPESLLNEILILERMIQTKNGGSRPMRLRGVIVKMGKSDDHFLFALTPRISQSSDIKDLNIDFSHFPLGDAIFDFLLLIQSERTARAKAEAARNNFMLENQISRLLHRLAAASVDFTDAHSTLQHAVTQVSREFNWSTGHFYWIKDDLSKTLTPSDFWYFSHPLKFDQLRQTTNQCVLTQDTGVAGQVLKTKKTVWINADQFDCQCPFSTDYQQLQFVCAVAVPVLIHGELVAILQFLSTTQPENQESLHRFFDILGLQLANVIERQQSQAREKQHFADLAMSSKLVTLGEMAAGVAHEINNPLSIIVMGAEKLERLQSQAGSEQKTDTNALAINLLSRIRLAAGRITKIVAGLRTFSRDGRNDAFTKAHLIQIVEDTLVLCQSRFEQTKVRFDVSDVPKDWIIDCQAVQISQALLNLLNNALDAALETKTPWVELDFKEDAGQIEISVTDSGGGIPDSLREKIMRPFFTTKPVGKGTGLGLSISSSILNSHGGSLKIDQDHPHTRFIMRLPKSNFVR